jgi:PAS domain S-box-containing protein
MTSSQPSFSEIVNIEELKKLFEAFSTATGFTTGLVDQLTREVLIGTGWRDICVHFHRENSGSIAHCQSSNQELTTNLNIPGEVRISHCRNGLIDGATPVIVEGRHLANLFTGQVLFTPPDKERFREQAQQYGYDEQSYLNALSKVPVMSEEEFTAMLCFLSHIATMVAKDGLTNLQSKKDQQEILNQHALLDSLINAIPDLIFYENKENVYLGCNKAFEEYAGYEKRDIVGHGHRDLLHNEVTRVFREKDPKATVSDTKKHNTVWATYPNGRQVLLDTLKTSYIGPDGTVLGNISISRDITGHHQTEMRLHQEIAARQKAAEVLQEKNKEIEEANIALRVLLNQQKNVAGDIQQRVLSQLEKAVLPYIDLLRQSPMDDTGKEYLSIICDHLREVGATFIKKLSNPDLKLTKREILVADLVRQGKSTKEIAKLLNLQPPSVETYRNKIRKKLHINNKSIRLHQYLNVTFTAEK